MTCEYHLILFLILKHWPGLVETGKQSKKSKAKTVKDINKIYEHSSHEIQPP